jgi:anti-sigma factor RsiW
VNCKEVLHLIDGYVDGELDLVRHMEMEGHLADCGSCLQAVKSRREVKEAIRAASLRFDAPKGLEHRILAAARREAKQSPARTGMDWRRFPNFAWLACGAAVLMFVVFNTWNIIRPNNAPHGQDTLAEELVSNHVRSLMASHLFDVASTDQHTVKPWFAGKLDYSPPVVDLANQGFPLTGGRLDYLDGRPVAALVYRHRKHVINLFVWPDLGKATESGRDLKTESLRGYHTIHWSKAGMGFHAVSDMNIADLTEFARDIAQGAGHPLANP